MHCTPTQEGDICIVTRDFRKLRNRVKCLGLMKSSVVFFWTMFMHSLLMDIASFALIIYNPLSWFTWGSSVILFACAQVSQILR